MSNQASVLLLELTAQEAVSVAAPESAGVKGVDLPVVKEPFGGRPYLPTSGIVGALRDHATRNCGLGTDRIVRLFGGRSPEAQEDVDSDEENQLQPSLLRALGTRMVAPVEPVQRTQTAIDRFRSAAGDRSLRSREELPTGTRVELYLCAVGIADRDREDLKHILATWNPIIGGSRSVGRGAMKVTSLRHRSLDLDTVGGLQEWLALAGPDTWVTDQWDKWPSGRGEKARTLSIKFTIASDVHVGTGARSEGQSPTAQMDKNPYVPGSSLKGVFRSRVELILRTMGLRSCAVTLHGDPQGWDGELESACTDDPCLTCRLFGFSPGGSDHGGKRSALYFHDSVVHDAGELQGRTHVAIDRFTGGQSHGLLFTQQIVAQGSVTVSITIADPSVAEIAEPLLKQVAVDIHDGFAGIGHGVARGMGALRLTDEDAIAFRKSWSAAREQIETQAGVGIA